MAVIERSEFLKKLTESVTDEARQLELLEDFADSFPEGDAPAAPDYESDENPYKAKYSDIFTKYRDRFLGKGETNNQPNGEQDDLDFEDVLAKEE